MHGPLAGGVWAARWGTPSRHGVGHCPPESWRLVYATSRHAVVAALAVCLRLPALVVAFNAGGGVGPAARPHPAMRVWDRRINRGDSEGGEVENREEFMGHLGDVSRSVALPLSMIVKNDLLAGHEVASAPITVAGILRTRSRTSATEPTSFRTGGSNDLLMAYASSGVRGASLVMARTHPPTTRLAPQEPGQPRLRVSLLGSGQLTSQLDAIRLHVVTQPCASRCRRQRRGRKAIVVSCSSHPHLLQIVDKASRLSRLLDEA